MGGCVENHSVVNLGPWNDLGDIRVAKKFRGDTERQIISGQLSVSGKIYFPPSSS